MMTYLARRNHDGTRKQTLQAHLNRTAKFASIFEAEDIAQRVGTLHDIGKYSDAFQRRIQGSNERVEISLRVRHDLSRPQSPPAVSSPPLH